MPVVRGCLWLPTSAAPVIEFDGSCYVNTWRNTMMAPNAEALNDLVLRPGLLLLRMLRESLCGKPDSKTIEETIAIANGKDPAEIEFRFLMTRLAAPLQSVGLNRQTNLWMLGELGGVGKGTLNQVMAQIYGPSNAVLVNGEDIQRDGWTDGLEGKLWVYINEINPDRRFDWNSFIKQYSTEAVISIRKRNNHAHPAINCANWFFTTYNRM